MRIKEVIAAIQSEAPLYYQESYDNSGLQVGDTEQETTGALLTLDVTEEVLEEAIQLDCNLIIAHHPLLFKPLKKIGIHSSIERIIIQAVKNNVVIFAAHTNLDNLSTGVNLKIAEKLGICNPQILSPIKNTILKLHTFVPVADCENLLNKLFEAGAGDIGQYSECSFKTTGLGTFKPGENSHPYIGHANGKRESVSEQRIEVIFPEERKNKILETLFSHHPYEEVAYGIVRMENADQTKGAGMIGNLAQPVESTHFLEKIKEKMQAACIRHTAIHKTTIQKIAFCGGSGSFLLKEAIQQGADLFLTADFKYHQFFDAENKIIIADIGHYESEQYTPEIFSEILKRKFPNFATYLTKVITNPVNYYF